MRRMQLTVFALGVALAMAVSAPVSHAQSPGEGARVGELFKAGQNALANGQYRAAAGRFAKVLRNNDLTSEQVAKALYMRGTAYEKDGRPAQAIADITSALYLSGLSSAERAKAYLVRGKAYEAVRLNDLARADISRARNGGVSEQQIARASEAPRSRDGGGSVPAFATTVAPSGGGSSTPSFTTRARSGQNRQAVPTFATSSQSGATPSTASTAASKPRQSASFETRSSSAHAREEQIPQFRTSILPQDTPPKKPPPVRTARSSGSTPAGSDTSVAGQQPIQPPEQESGSRVGRFFRGLKSKATGRDEEKQTTSAPPAASAPTATSPSPQWSQTTSVARAPQPSWNSQVSSPPPAQRSRAAPQPPAVAPAPQPASPASSGYRIQLAALRSDADAQATWKRLQAKHGALLGSYQPSIVKTDLGGLGTFYRVQLGPFPDKAATQQLCKNFKSGGLDCFLLAQ